MLCWNVYCGNCNSREIEIFNVFDHYGFYGDCVKAKRKHKDDRDGFAEEVRKSLFYYFRAKCEWETVVTHWPSGEYYDMRKSLKVGELVDGIRSAGVEYDCERKPWVRPDTEVTIRVFPNYIKDKDRKIDVYEQVMNNWPVFVEYLWNNKKELKARK